MGNVSRIVTVFVLISGIAACGRRDQASFQSVNEVHEGPVYVRVPKAYATKAFVKEYAFNRDHAHHADFVFGYVARERLDGLKEKLGQELVILDEQKLRHERFDGSSLTEIIETTPKALNFENYHNYAALTQELQTLAQRYPDKALLESAGKSVQGRELWLLRIASQQAVAQQAPKILLIANMHGDEVVGREVMIYLSRALLQEESFAKLSQQAQIYIMPSMNPDGFEAHSRFNANGIDLNRDFPDFTSDPTDSPKGRAGETAVVMALHDKHEFSYSLNFHGGEVCFNLPWDTKENSERNEMFSDIDVIKTIGRRYADLNKTMKANDSFDHGLTFGYEWYEVDGGMQDWSNYYRGSNHATVELSYTKWPGASQLPTMWEENRTALRTYLENALFGVHLKIQDEAGNPLLGASVEFRQVGRAIKHSSAVIHRPTMNTTQHVRIAAAGYQTQEITLQPSAFSGSYHVITLKK